MLGQIAAVSEQLLVRGLFATAQESMVAQYQPVPDYVQAWPRIKGDWSKIFFIVVPRERA